MSDINSSLIGFLKKKSLFSDSPAKSLRFRERSRDQQPLGEGARTPPHPNNQPHNFNTGSSRNLHK